MIVGVTATQAGATSLQLHAVDLTAWQWRPREFHDGDCIGGDWACNLIMRMYGVWTVGHPPANSKKRAFGPHDEWWPEKPYTDRNADVVTCIDRLLVLPRGPEASYPYSGTWATYRLAMKLRVPCYLVWPDGTREKR